MVRPPHTFSEVLAHLPPDLDAKEWAPRLVETPAMDVSSTEIRRWAEAGENVAPWVGEDVARYILENGLYGGTK